VYLDSSLSRNEACTNTHTTRLTAINGNSDDNNNNNNNNNNSNNIAF